MLKDGILFIGEEKPIKSQLILGEDDAFIPVSSERSSVPDVYRTFAPSTKLAIINPDYALEYLATLENLAAFNNDISYALDNIVQLANTEHDIYFSDKVPEKLKNEMLLFLHESEGQWYELGSGVRSLKADIISQIVINGCASVEVIPTARLDNVKQVVRVSPKQIRFVYNKETDSFDPYQANVSGLIQKPDEYAGMIKLNPTTYRYIALRRLSQNPYPAPPFISAIESLVTKRDMVGNFNNIMKKLGMLGFLSANVTPPVKLPGEDNGAYWQRCNDYLANVVYPQLNKNLGKGVVAGFKDTHEFKLEGNNMNVQGAAGLMDIVMKNIYSGVKQDPNMLGDNMATTETFGRVIMLKMISQAADYQSVCDNIFEHVYMMALRLRGYSPGYVKVVSRSPMVADKVNEETAQQLKIANVISKRNAGFISQDIAAQELEYDKPFLPGDIAPPTEPTPTNATQSNVVIRQIENSLNAFLPQFDYSVPDSCDTIVATRENFLTVNSFKGLKELEQQEKKYFNAVNSTYKKATKKVAKIAADRIAKLPTDARLETVQHDVYLAIITKWATEFQMPVKSDIEDNVGKIYSHYRKDKSIFSSTKTGTSANKLTRFDSKDIPAAVLDLTDFRTIAYMEKSDEMYLGKFITDSDTKKAIYEYIKEEYIGGYLPIGASDDAIEAFANKFSDELNLEAWKIRRVIDTTVNKLRNYGHVEYMSQAEVEHFEVIEMMDNLTCQWCDSMNGKVFSVETACTKIANEVSNGAGDVATTSPFLTKLSIEEVRKSSPETLQSMGYDTPPYHCHCRGTMGAVD